MQQLLYTIQGDSINMIHAHHQLRPHNWPSGHQLRTWHVARYDQYSILAAFLLPCHVYTFNIPVPLLILNTLYLKTTCLTKTKLRHVTRVWSRLSARCCCYHLQHPSCGGGHTSHPVYEVTPCVLYRHPVYVVTPGCSDTACVVFISTTVTSVSEIFTFYSRP